MTALAGILCRNGVGIGSDSATTFSQGVTPSIEQPSNKIHIIDNKLIIAGTGPIGINQRFCEIIEELWKQKKFAENSAIGCGKMMSHCLIQDLQKTFLKPGQYGALVAFTAKGGKPHLCEIGLKDLQPELKTEDMWFCTMGATYYMTDPFLGLLRGVYWDDKQPDLHDGIFAATWTIDHAIELGVSGVNQPTRIAILEPNKKGQYFARFVEDHELQEYRQNIEEVKDQLRFIRSQQICNVKPEEVPEVPEL